MTIHQFVPVLLKNDAVGNCARELGSRLRRIEPDSRIFVEDYAKSDKSIATPIGQAVLSAKDVLIYHYANYSPLAVELASQSRTFLYYHNITPPEFFAPWDGDTALAQSRARKQLGRLARLVAGALSVSEYNSDELRRLGVPKVFTVGLLADYDLLESQQPTPKLARLSLYQEHRGSPADWLFVGRLVPNKAQELLIASFRIFRELTGYDATLTLIGRPFAPSYLAALRGLVEELGVATRVHILSGGLPPRYLADHYRAASLFVSGSRHEGFGAPLVEAMRMGLPVVALSRTGVTETLGSAGILVEDDDPVSLAVSAMVASRNRDLLIASGRARAAEFTNEKVWGRFLQALPYIRNDEN